MQDWMKQTLLFLGLSVCWDVVRTIVQAYLTRWVMLKDFNKVHKAIDDVEDAIEDVEEAIEEDNVENLLNKIPDEKIIKG